MAGSKLVQESNSVFIPEPVPAREQRFSRLQKFGRSVGKFLSRAVSRNARRPSGSSLSASSTYSQADSKNNIIKVEQNGDEIRYHYPLVPQTGSFASLPETLIRIPIIEDMKPIMVHIIQHSFFKGHILVGELHINVLQDVGLGMISRSLLLHDKEKSIYQTVYAKPVLTYRIDHALDHPAGEYAYLQLIQVDTLMKCMFSTCLIQAGITSPQYMGLTIETDEEVASKHIITDTTDERLLCTVPELTIDHQRSNESILQKPSIKAVSTHSMTSTNASLYADDYLMSIECDLVDNSTSEEEDPLQMLIGYGQDVIDATPLNCFPSASMESSFDFSEGQTNRLIFNSEERHPFYHSRSSSMSYANFVEEQNLKSSSSSSIYYSMQEE